MGQVISVGEAFARVEAAKSKPKAPAPAGFQLDMSTAFVLRHDPEHPQWRNPVVWQGESERQIRALCAQFGFERVPYSLDELIVLLPYLKWCYTRKEALHKHYPADTLEGMIEATVQTIAMYFPQWAPGLDAYLKGDMAALKELHRGDGIYERLLAGAPQAEIDAEAAKVLAIAFPDAPHAP